MKYVAYINLDWLEMVFADKDIAGEPEKQREYLESVRKELADFIKGDDPEPFISYSWLDRQGHEHRSVEILQLMPTEAEPISLPESTLKQLAQDGQVTEEGKMIVAITQPVIEPEKEEEHVVVKKSTMKFHRTAPTGGDCTAPYDVTGYQSKTAAEFVNEVLESQPGEWGYIDLESGERIEYKHGKLLNEVPSDWKDINIGHVKASGGWSRMDYVIFSK